MVDDDEFEGQREGDLCSCPDGYFSEKNSSGKEILKCGKCSKKCKTCEEEFDNCLICFNEDEEPGECTQTCDVEHCKTCVDEKEDECDECDKGYFGEECKECG